MALAGPNRVQLHEVAPRDGLQIEPVFVPTEQKIAWIDRLSETGIAKIEATSFVSPKHVPALADGEAVLRGIRRRPGVRYAALIPNAKGAERAAQAKPDEVNVVISASETHNRSNLRMPRSGSFAALADIRRALEGSGVDLTSSVATSFGCPFEGRVDPNVVLDQVQRLLDEGCVAVTLADTTGMANPRQVAELTEAVLARHPGLVLTLHFHNTRGVGLANVMAGWQAGATRFDAALGGLGGCPFAPGATGNVCSEDVVSMFEEMGVSTGVDLDALLAVSKDLPGMIGHDVPGQVRAAGRPMTLHQPPDYARAA
ncbi:hydroxymethylglutaryl-CoA lyase [Enterovirga rhinocerotis]|uniref:Hydroxymethylglutaryl-CoA lyase n=1 Tax=Enterovirga rhinocerotis TaxID=1339210 RepID=A0A4R7BP33_9HYPH|nr:hydroxymethylglutaryl-CoA lyase [Enterovirga rhinocerotis]TDR87294.1 hydroxymethylglutaryl-CoA lyase [Enterovirga rhinocerotis]